MLCQDGKPREPDWQRQTAGALFAEQQHKSYCQQYDEEHDILIVAGDQELFDENAQLLQKHPKTREKRCRSEIERLLGQKKKSSKGAGKGEDEEEDIGLLHSKTPTSRAMRKLMPATRDALRAKMLSLGWGGWDVSATIAGHSKQGAPSAS